MSEKQIGMRVGTILGVRDNTVEILGFGVYEGDFIPEEAVGFMADLGRKSKIKNPRIKLDNGKVVYGCECYWGPEEQFKKKIAQYAAFKEVDIDEIREKYRKEAAEQADKGRKPETASDGG